MRNHHHLEHLAAKAEDLGAMLSRPHGDDGDIHPTALAQPEPLKTNFRTILHTLTHPTQPVAEH